MSSQSEPEVILYDLACTKGVCFSPVVWKTRMMLNYKQIPYKTVFLEFQEIEPTLKGLGIPAHDPPIGDTKYTVPAISIPSRGTLLMDSYPIAEFLESAYPSPPLPLTSPLGAELETKARGQLGAVFRFIIMPREVRILSPEAAAYFRRTREARIGGQKLEAVLEGEEKAWKSVDEAMKELSPMILTNQANGRFLLGEQVSYTDFFIAGFLQCTRVIDEGVWKRMCEYPGFGQLYEACQPFMEKKD